MKIKEAKALYSAQLNALQNQRQKLASILKEDTETGRENFDRLELSRQLSVVDREYEQAAKVMEHLQLRESILHNAESAKQQGDAMADALDNMMKCLEIYRRIAEGATVPPADEKLLMDYSQELYMSAKTMALLQSQKERKEYDSLIEEEDQAEPASPSEIAENAEAGLPPSAVPAQPAAPAE